MHIDNLNKLSGKMWISSVDATDDYIKMFILTQYPSVIQCKQNVHVTVSYIILLLYVK